MKNYIFEYRDVNYKPQHIIVEAEGKKDAISKAKEKLTKDDYLVESPKRCFIGRK